MSIGRRLVNLVRSNLNNLLDAADDSDRPASSGRPRIEDLSDAEIEAELRRRRERRSAASRAAERAEREQPGARASSSASYDREAWAEVEEVLRGSGRFRTAGRRPRRTGRHEPARRRSGRENQLAKLYAQLECPYGSDIKTIRKQYRVMMRKYHPDMHSGDPNKQRLATELSQKLTQAYNELRRSIG